MKNLREIKQAFDQNIVPNLGSLADKMFYMKLYATALLAGMIIAFFTVMTNRVTFFMIDFLMMLVLFFLIYKDTDTLTKLYQRLVVGPLVKAIDRNFTYLPQQGISQNIFYKTPFIPYRSHAKYKSSNHIVYRTKEHRFRCADVNVIIRRKKRSSLLYSGLFGMITLPRRYEHTILIVPDFAEKHMGAFGKEFLQFKEIDGLMKLNINHDSYFEKHFIVYTSCEDEARMFLDESMRKLLIKALKMSSYNSLQLSIVGDKAYVGAPSVESFFGFSIGLSKRLSVDHFDHLENSVKNLLAASTLLTGVYDRSK